MPRQRSRWIVSAAIAAAFGTALCLPSAAAAAPLWLGPSQIAVSRHQNSDPAVATNSAGDAALAWISRGSLRLVLRSGARGPWRRSHRMFPGAVRPQIAIDADGDVIAVWEHWEGTSLVLQGSFKPAGRNWQGPTALSGDVGEGQGRWRLVMNPRGDAALVWSQYRVEDFFGHPLDVYMALARTMPRANGTWGPAVQLSSPAADATSPDIALDDSGNLLAAWHESERSAPATVRAATGSAVATDGAWTSPVSLAATDGEGEIRVAIGPASAGLVAWTQPGEGCGPRGAMSLVGASRAPGGGWSAPAQISRAGECAVEPRVAVTHGESLAIWDSIGRTSSLEVAAAPAGNGSWKVPTRLATIGLTPTGHCRDICPGSPLAFGQLAVAANGQAVAVWSQPETGIHAALKPGRSIGWQAPTALSLASNAFGPRVGTSRIAVDPQGNAIAVWAAGSEIQVDALAAQQPIRNASLSRNRFSVSGPDQNGPSVGTRIRFTLSTAARLRVAVVRLEPGVRPGLRCVPARRQLREKSFRRCTRKEFVGVLSKVVERSGKSSLALPGRLEHRALRPGVYEALLSAHGEKQRSAPVALPFTILH